MRLTPERTPLYIEAEEYAASLYQGATILDDVDAEYIAPFRHLLGAVLCKRGLALEPIVGGWLVVSSRKQPRVIIPPPGPVRVQCGRCSESWFDCGHCLNTAFQAIWPDNDSLRTPPCEYLRPKARA